MKKGPQKLQQQKSHKIQSQSINVHRILKVCIFIFILLIIQIETILISIPFNINSIFTYLFAQIILLISIILSFCSILNSTSIHNLQQLFKSNSQDVKNIFAPFYSQNKQNSSTCIKCKIQKVIKIVWCEKCKKYVHKQYFHTEMLGCCINEGNFSSYVALMIFLLIYLIVVGINHVSVLFEFKLSPQGDMDQYFYSSIRSQLTIIFFIIHLALIFVVIFLLSLSYFSALQTKKSFEQFLKCSSDCHKNNSQIDKNNQEMIKKFQVSIGLLNCDNQITKQTNFTHNNHNGLDSFSRDIEPFSLNELQFQQKGDKIQLRQYHAQLSNSSIFPFKTDFFSSAKIFKKKLLFLQIQKNRKQSYLNNKSNKNSKHQINKGEFLCNSQCSRSDSFVKRNSQLIRMIEIKMANLIEEEQKRIKQKQGQQRERKSKRPLNRKFLSAFAPDSKKRLQDINQNRQPKCSKIKFIKRISNVSNMMQIFQGKIKHQLK